MESKRKQPTRGQQLWKIYETELGETVSYSTWKRRLSELKQLDRTFNLRSKNAPKKVKNFAKIRRKRKRIGGRGEHHSSRMKAFKFIRNINRDLTGIEFLQLLSNYLQIPLESINQSNFYYWFSRVDLKYNSKELYKNEDLAFVAYVAAILAINKRSNTETDSTTTKKLSK
ncbi:MAG: hypothetical protein AAF630_12415 [Cyanobacteria bacterium P01_C01_bin.38]